MLKVACYVITIRNEKIEKNIVVACYVACYIIAFCCRRKKVHHQGKERNQTRQKKVYQADGGKEMNRVIQDQKGKSDEI